jgi:hypothetical protein
MRSPFHGNPSHSLRYVPHRASLHRATVHVGRCPQRMRSVTLSGLLGGVYFSLTETGQLQGEDKNGSASK